MEPPVQLSETNPLNHPVNDQRWSGSPGKALRGLTNYWPIVLLLIVLAAPFVGILLAPGKVLGHPIGDNPKGYYQFGSFLGQCWRDGVMPFWNSHIMLGIPFLGEGQASVFHPLTFLFAIFEPDVAVNGLIIIAFVLTGIFFYGYLRALGLAQPAAWSGAVVWSFSSAMVSRISAGHLNILLTFLSIPMILMFWEQYRSRGRMRYLVGIALGYALMIFAYYPQFLYIFSLFFLLYVVIQSGSVILDRSSTVRQEGKAIGMLGLFILLAIGIGSIQLLPSLDFVSRSFRREATMEYCGTFSFPPENLLTLIAPGFFGSTFEMTPGRYWGRAIFWEMWLYIGVLPLMMAVAGAWAAPRRLRVALLSCGIVFLILGLGKNTFLFPVMYEHVPFFDIFRGSSKNTLITLLCLATLSAFGFQALFGEADKAKRQFFRRIAVISGASMFLICGLVAIFLVRDAEAAGSNWEHFLKWILNSSEVYLDPITSDGRELARITSKDASGALIRGMILLVVSVGLIFLRFPGRWGRFSFLLPITFILIDLMGTFLPMLPTFDKSTAQMVLNLEESAKTPYPPRLVVPFNPMPNVAMGSGFSSVFGYTGNTLQRYNDLITRLQNLDPKVSQAESRFVNFTPQFGMLGLDAVAVNREDMQPGAQVIGKLGDKVVIPFQDSGKQPRAFLAAAPKYVSRPEDALSYVLSNSTVWVSPAIEGREKNLTGRPLEKEEAVRFISFQRNRIELEARTIQPRELVLCEMFEENWKATVNGEPVPVAPANHVFRAVQVPPGTSRVIFEYKPESFYVGANVTAISLIVLLSLVTGATMKSRFLTRVAQECSAASAPSPALVENAAVTGQPARSGTLKPVAWASVALALLTAGILLPVIFADFVPWDDNLNIYGNPHIQQLTGENLKWMFTDTTLMRRYVPLSWLNWSFLCHFFGLNPAAFHGEALLLHVANTLLVFWLMLQLLQRAKPEIRAGSWPVVLSAGFAAAIWAIHPLRVEVVAWANCQMYAQAWFFTLLALFSYLRAVDGVPGKPGSRMAFLWLAVVLFACSLLTYPAALGFVVLLLVLDVFVLRRLSLSFKDWFSPSARPVLIEKLPFLALTVGVLLVTLWARANMAGIWTGTSNVENFGWPSRMAQAFYVWAYYLWKPFLPFDLSPVYTQLVSFRPTDWPFLLSTGTVIGVTGLLVWQRRRWPMLLAAWICHLVLLIPMLGLTEHPHYPNDRYNYLASVPWSILLAAGLLKLLENRSELQTSKSVFLSGLSSGLRARVVFALMAGITAVAAVASSRQIPMWKNSEAFFLTIIKRLGDDPYRCDTWWRLGVYHASEGRWKKAKECHTEALKIKPDFISAHYDLAGAYFSEGNMDKALTHYGEVLRLSPKHPSAHFNLAVVKEKQGRLDEAHQHYASAVEADPNNADAHLALASALSRLGRANEAVDHVLTAVRLKPNSPEVNFNAGNALMMQQKVPEALKYFSSALRLKPHYPEAEYNLGTAIAMSGNVGEALLHFAEAARQKPDYAEAQLAQGMALSMLGRVEESIPRFREALRLQTDLIPALMNLGAILVQTDSKFRDPAEAVRLVKRAAELTQHQNLEVLHLLMTAYKMAGNSSEAEMTGRRALELARASGQQEAVSQLETKLKEVENESITRR